MKRTFTYLLPLDTIANHHSLYPHAAYRLEYVLYCTASNLTKLDGAFSTIVNSKR